MAGGLAFPLFVLTLAALVYGLYGFDGVLLRDYAIHRYGGQGMAEGIPLTPTSSFAYTGCEASKIVVSMFSGGFSVAVGCMLSIDIRP